MRVDEAMRHDVATVAADESIAAAAKTMKARDASAVVVVDRHGGMAGILTERDVVGLVVDGVDPTGISVQSRMSGPLVTVEPSTEVTKARELLTRNHLRHLPVVEGGRLVGMFTAVSALDHAAGVRRAEQAGTGVLTAFRGPWADGPPAPALEVRLPPVDRLRIPDLLRLMTVGGTLACLVALAVLRWAVRPRHGPLVTAASNGLVDAFERLGPTFVKVGQLVTSSPGVFPVPLAEACERCLDDVLPFPSEAARRVVEEDLGRPTAQLFKSFDDLPLASASVAQVHACVLPDGREAVLKLQRPGINKTMNADLRILYVLAGLAEHFELGKRLALKKFIIDMHQVTNQELNCALEAHRQHHFRDRIGAFGDNKDVTAPEVYWDYCGPRTICMERMYGVPIDSFDVLRERNVDGETLLRKGIKVSFEAVCIHGPFHGDVHAGNIWVLDDGREAYLDFGLMGELPPRWRRLIAELFKTAMIDNNWSRVVRNYKDVGVLPEGIGSDDEVGARLQLVLQPMFELAAGSVALGEVFKQQIALAESMGATAPQELMLIAKQVFYFERYVKVLAPDYRMAKDLFLIKNIWPDEVAATAELHGITFPE